MSDCIVLSDSGESVSLVENDRAKRVGGGNRSKHCLDDSDSNDFEFPPVNFCRTAVEKDQEERNLYANTVNNGSNKSNIKSFQSGLDRLEFPIAGKSSRLDDVDKSLSRDTYAWCDSTQDSEAVRKQREGRKGVTSVARKTKSQVTEDRLKRQKRLMREKALKVVASKKQKNIQPGECMKFMEVVFDKGIENFDFFKDIKTMLLGASVQYNVKAELIPNSITWRRNIEESYVNAANEICTVTDIEKLNETLIVWNSDEAVRKVADGSFCASISSMKSVLARNNLIIKLVLIIVGMDDYFAHRKGARDSVKSQGRNKLQKNKRKSTDSDEFKSLPDISREEFELCLNEIEITCKCSSRLLNDSQDIALMVYQCTKAIALTPYKLEKNKNLSSKFDWYVMGDNRNTVSVDKDGNGLKRLWQQQLCQFNLSSLEVAEAISSVYPSPADLTKVCSIIIMYQCFVTTEIQRNYLLYPFVFLLFLRLTVVVRRTKEYTC